MLAKMDGRAYLPIKTEATMSHSIDLVYLQYIKPLSYYDRVFIVQRILQDFVSEQKKEANSQVDKLKNLRRFKGIAKGDIETVNEEDWYKQ